LGGPRSDPQRLSPNAGAGCEHAAMDAADLRRCCLAHTGAVEEFPFGPGTSVFKVAGKIFALSALDGSPLEVSVKCEPELAVELRGTYAAIRPGYHLNKRHWNTVTLDGSLPAELIRDLVEDSYDLVVSALPKHTRQKLAWAPEARIGSG
jgi:predicted DNA-binding protein (MmcQ/YjbR family)